MKALIYHGTGDVRLDDVPTPTLAQSEDILVEVTATTICGTDLHPYRGSVPRDPGTPMGHEAVGVVDGVGADVKHVRPGDRVIIPAAVGCGYCAYCTEGYHSNCQTPGAGTIRGAQAEVLRVPFAPANVIKIPEGMSDEAALTLTDIFPTGYFGAELAQVKPGEAVAVFGAGPVGLFAMHSARLKGAGRIFAIDDEPERLEMAAREGFHAIHFGQEDPVAALKRLTGGFGPDACIEAVGGDAVDRQGEKDPLCALRWAIEAVKPAGQVAVLGVYGPDMTGFPLAAAFEKNVTLRMGGCPHRRYIPHLLTILQAGILDPTFVYTGASRLESLVDAYRRFERHEHVKLLVLTEAGHRRQEEQNAKEPLMRMAR